MNSAMGQYAINSAYNNALYYSSVIFELRVTWVGVALSSSGQYRAAGQQMKNSALDRSGIKTGNEQHRLIDFQQLTSSSD